MLDQLLYYDQQLLIFINNLGQHKFDAFWIFITNTLHWIPLFILIFFWVFKKHTGKEVWSAVLAYIIVILGILLFTELIKQWIMRPRPCQDILIYPKLRQVYCANNYSFFSGHAAASFAISLLTYLLFRKKVKFLKWIWIWPLIFTFSRLYLGVHYPLDVFVGAIMGSALAASVYVLRKKLA